MQCEILSEGEGEEREEVQVAGLGQETLNEGEGDYNDR